MASQTVRVEGLRQLQKSLKELPRATGKNALKRALMSAGKPIESSAKARAPRLSGHLQRSVTTGTKLTQRQKKQHKKESAVEVFVGAGGLPQAHLQEFGTAEHGPQPFLRPAWDGNKMTALNLIKTDLAKEIEKARARLARKAERLAAKIKAT